MNISRSFFKRCQEDLEFPEILKRLADLAKSSEGRELCLALEPQPDLEAVEMQQSYTADALTVLNQRKLIPLRNFPNIDAGLKKAQISSAVLSMEELYDLRIFLESVYEIQSFLPKADTEFYLEDNKFYETIAELEPCTSLRKELQRCLISKDIISENASPKLREIRQEIDLTQNRIKRNLEKIVKSSGEVLQDQLITIRRGRYVIPVKANNKKKVSGIVHDSSQSGQTLFIEPMAVVEENNYLQELAASEEREIWRILASLTNLVSMDLVQLENDKNIMAELDFMQAKARLAQIMQATRPVLNDRGYINLKAARHPHIPAKKVVPIDLSLGDKYRTLLITGPNTGGKTVALKTCGLLTLMAMSGLQIPAAENSSLSVFANIFTDIGDEQSISEDLSTFSAHIETLVNITENVNEHTLVLIDELGSGTDPDEGAALAVAVLEYLRAKNCVTLVTTHFKELKIYALETAGVENASMEFDNESLRPTYKVLVGVPGTSHAFSIAERMGLDVSIINRAKAELSTAELNFENVIKEIESTRVDLEEQKTAVEQLKQDLQTKMASYNKEIDSLKLARQTLQTDERQAKRTQLKRQSQAVDALIDELAAKQTNNSTVTLEDARALRSLLRADLKDVENEIGFSTLEKVQEDSEKYTEDPEISKQLQVGDEAYAPGLDLNGTIMTPKDNQGRVQFKSGQLTVVLDYSSLKPAKLDKNKSSSPAVHTSNKLGSTGASKMGSNSVKTRVRANFSAEIMLIGKKVEEALPELDAYLDDAVLANVDEVRIVHGKGTGALRQAVHEFLRRDKRVAKFKLAEFGEGDAGVTIAFLK